MTKKLGLLCLSAMVLALAVGCSTNRTVSAKAISESARENRSEEKTRREDEGDSSNGDITTIGSTSSAIKTIFHSKSRCSNEEVTVSLNTVVRGNEAKVIIDNYNKNNITSKIPDLINDSLEYVIIEYTTTFSTNMKSTEDGQTSNLNIEVTNFNGDTLKTSGTNYIIRNTNFEITSNIQPGQSGVTKAVLTIPKATQEFIVKLGDSKDKQAIFLIQ